MPGCGMTLSPSSVSVAPALAPWSLLLGVYLDSQGSFCSDPASLLGLNARPPPAIVPDYQLRARSQSRSSCLFPQEAPGSPPGSEVFPGPRSRTDHGGEGQGSQEGEEGQV